MKKLNFKNFGLIKGDLIPPQLTYKHKNGYIQNYLMDEFQYNDDYSALNEYQSFKNIIKMGTNKLYYAYSLLPPNLISKNGYPEINLTFDQANQYIITGCLPNAEQLQENEQNKNQLQIGDIDPIDFGN